MPLFQESGHANDSERLAEARRLAEEILPFEDELTPRERAFVEGMHAAFEKYGDKAQCSAKQLFWLRDIYGRVI